MQQLRSAIGSHWRGLAVIIALTAGAFLLSKLDSLAHFGLSALTLAILLGALAGNALPTLAGVQYNAGMQLAQKRFLRTGVALYGFNLSVQQIAQLGLPGIEVDVLMVISTLAIGWVIGRYLLGMDRETALLTTVGSAICGAAAVVATMPVLTAPGEDDSAVREKATAAVATVVLFGSLAMLVYPALHAWLGGTNALFGLYVGSTVHEVAQVVAIGSTLGESGAHAAVIAKMLRVMMLVPFLLAASAIFQRKRNGASTGSAPISIPWFAIAFMAFAGVNSTGLIPTEIVALLRQAGTLLLTAAMAALGVNTTLAKVRAAGFRPILLGLILFAHLIITGHLVNTLLA